MADQFVQIPLALLTDDRVNDGAIRVYGALLSFADHGTLANCHPSIKGVAARSNRSRSKAAVALGLLEKTGWITRHPRKSDAGDSDTTLYKFPKQPLVCEGSPESDTTQSQKRDYVGAQTGLPGIANGTWGSPKTGTGVVPKPGHDREPFTENHFTDKSTTASQQDKEEKRTRKRTGIADPTIEETTQHFCDLGATDPSTMADACQSYWQSRGYARNGERIKDWKATCRTWWLNQCKWEPSLASVPAQQQPQHDRRFDELEEARERNRQFKLANGIED